MKKAFWVFLALLSAAAAFAHDQVPFEFLKQRLTQAQFVEQSFQGVLGRRPSPSERQGWVSTLKRGSTRWSFFRALVDSEAFRGEASDEEFVTSAFVVVVERPPVARELRAFVDALEMGRSRSDCLRALLMSRDFARRNVSPFFLMDDLFMELHPSRVPGLAGLVRRSKAADHVPEFGMIEPPRPSLRRPERTAVEGGLVELSARTRQSSWTGYRGFLHAHSRYSIDARKKAPSPRDAWIMARDEAGMDFMGLSEHAEFLGANRFESLRQTAAEMTEPGVFVAFPGFEYSNPAMGHYVVMNTTKFVSALNKWTVSKFYDWLEGQPRSIVTFNHPGGYDLFGVEFNHFELRSSLAEQMVGIETIQNNGFEEFSVGYDGSYDYYNEALLMGWRVGSVTAQDNHVADYGLRNDVRTVVLAPDLTMDGLLEGYRARRFYASEDKNLELNFTTSAGAEMGSALGRGAASFLVGFDDPDKEQFTRIDVYRDGNLFRTEPVVTTSGTWGFDVPDAGADHYYYVQVEQADGDRAESSPIWLTASATGTSLIR